MIVVDTNVIAYFWIKGPHTAATERAFSLDSDWVATPLWRSELRNVLTVSIRRGAMALDHALYLLERAENQLAGREYPVISTRVMACVARSHCSAYDCEFVALAEELGVPLVTTDKQVLAEFPSVAVALESFATEPDGLGS